MSETYKGDGTLRDQVERGANRIKTGLLALAAERPLTDEEGDQLNMLFDAQPATKKFAKFVKRNGMEE